MALSTVTKLSPASSFASPMLSQMLKSSAQETPRFSFLFLFSFIRRRSIFSFLLLFFFQFFYVILLEISFSCCTLLMRCLMLEACMNQVEIVLIITRIDLTRCLAMASPLNLALLASSIRWLTLFRSYVTKERKQFFLKERKEVFFFFGLYTNFYL